MDVAAISWRYRALLLGEAKWTENNVGLEVLNKLLGWTTERVLELPPPNKNNAPQESQEPKLKERRTTHERYFHKLCA